ncbi:putative serine/threonine-protein kinase [Trichoplax sp. H2]|nr:putative serine/threonine-protein kinase [Trichoplax sp. H2]|eukprot:RDD41893.1 putative serine/threonine-protein kinase [Trichoplax sp. H2]
MPRKKTSPPEKKGSKFLATFCCCCYSPPKKKSKEKSKLLKNSAVDDDRDELTSSSGEHYPMEENSCSSRSHGDNGPPSPITTYEQVITNREEEITLPQNSYVTRALDAKSVVGYYGKVSGKIDMDDGNKHYVFKQWNNVIFQDINVGKQVEILLRIRHENIIKVLVYIRNDSFGGVLEEYCHITLHNRLFDIGPTNSAAVLDCFRRYRILFDIMMALKYLHEKKIVHNNITSYNILLTQENKAKLTHGGYQSIFSGIDRAIDRTYFKTVPTKLEYYSPQALTGILQPENDIYSFGVIILVMVIGNEPYQPNNKQYRYAMRVLREDSDWSMLKDFRIKWPKNQVYPSRKTFRKVLLRTAYECVKKNKNSRPTLNDLIEKFIKYEARYFQE